MTLQIVALVGTTLFYLFAATGDERTRDRLAKIVITTLYDRHQWRWLRDTKALEFHILISLTVQLSMLIPTILLVIGASRGIRYLLLPWLVLFGLLQITVFVSIILVVIFLTKIEYKVSVTELSIVLIIIIIEVCT